MCFVLVCSGLICVFSVLGLRGVFSMFGLCVCLAFVSLGWCVCVFGWFCVGPCCIVLQSCFVFVCVVCVCVCVD